MPLTKNLYTTQQRSLKTAQHRRTRATRIDGSGGDEHGKESAGEWA
jgi:hypothetical protein